jgi:prephenate dehydrogenase
MPTKVLAKPYPEPSSQPGRTTAQVRRSVTLIGGAGAMGRLLSAAFIRAGWEVRGLDCDDWGRAAALLEGCQVALICVPGHEAVGVVDRLRPYLSPETVLADILSAKREIIPAMREGHYGPVVSLHPMFGPSLTSLVGQNMVVIPVRGSLDALEWLDEVFGPEGVQFTYTSADEHEQAMALVQALTHFVLLNFGRVVAEAGIDLRTIRKFASPNFRILLNLASRISTQPPDLYVDILFGSPNNLEPIRRLSRAFARFLRVAESGDRPKITEEFARLSEALGDDARIALVETQTMIDALANLAEPPADGRGRVSTK